MGLFGKSGSNPKDKVQDWIRKLRKEIMSIDRQIRGIEREEAKTRLVIKETAKQGDESSCRLMAVELINSRKTIDRLITSKARINSVIMVMNTQLANLKISGNLAKSSEIMKSMQGLISVPELSIEMRKLSKEMVKAGIMEEMISETIEQLNVSEGELSEEEGKLLDKLLFETTQGKMGKKVMKSADPDDNNNKQSKSSESESKKETIKLDSVDKVKDEDDSIVEMEKRLEALRS